VSEAGPLFYYDLASPYAYLAAHRVDEMLAVPVRWVPVVAAGDQLFWGDDRLQQAAAALG
jgi:2-hydroxychromene-2-carboxylate isomerase